VHFKLPHPGREPSAEDALSELRFEPGYPQPPRTVGENNRELPKYGFFVHWLFKDAFSIKGI
jgi:hypothetical protein